MSNIDNTDGFGTPDADTKTDRKTQAKQMAGKAAEAVKAEAQSFAGTAQQRLRGEAQKHTQTATKTLGDFAGAIRKAGDELSQADQSPAAKLVGQAADGLERLSLSLADKQPEDLLDAVRDFGRRHPMAFIAGGVLVGVALGRFVRSSEEERIVAPGGAPAYPIAASDYDPTSSFAGLAEDVDATDVRDLNTTGAGIGHADDDTTPTPRSGF